MDALDRLLTGLRRPKVLFKELVRGTLLVVGVFDVDATDPVSFRAEPADQVMANESASACDKNLVRPRPACHRVTLRRTYGRRRRLEARHSSRTAGLKESPTTIMTWMVLTNLKLLAQRSGYDSIIL